MNRRWLPVVFSLALTSLVGACGTPGAGPGPRESRASSPSDRDAGRQRLAEARARSARRQLDERCERERPELTSRMAALRRAESRLARLKEETYVPSPPPAPWDEAFESRFRLEDREADLLRHQRQQEAWRQREESRRASWWADHQARLRQAQARLNREAQALRSRRADLFTGPASIEFKPTVVEQIRQCPTAKASP
ncbi:MAG: hypothetical protein ACK6AD_04995 [Cyanobacteriota bacterium]